MLKCLDFLLCCAVIASLPAISCQSEWNKGLETFFDNHGEKLMPMIHGEIPKAVFFDLDATLCHRHPNYHTVFSHALRGVSQYEAFDYDEIYNAWMESLHDPGPMTTESVLTATFERVGIRGDYSVAKIAEGLTRSYVPGIRVFEGVYELLAALRECGCRLGIITNGPYDTQLAVIQHLRLDEYVDVIVISGDENIGVRKPSHEIFHYALALVEAAPHEAVMVGDTPEKDLIPAEEIGMTTIHITAPEDIQAALKLTQKRISALKAR